MKKEIKKMFIWIAINIIILVCIGTLMTFIPEHLRGFFGDTISIDKKNSLIDQMYNWGARHYWYFWGCFLLFLLRIIYMVVWISSWINKYKN